MNRMIRASFANNAMKADPIELSRAHGEVEDVMSNITVQNGSIDVPDDHARKRCSQRQLAGGGLGGR